MKLKLVTTDRSLLKWGSLGVKKREVLKALNKGINANFTDFDIELRTDLKPVVTSKKRISHKWLDTITEPFFREGYDFVGLHFSKRGWRNAGLKTTHRGSNPIDDDVQGEFYMWADERTVRRYTRGGSNLNQFIQVMLHEMCHEYYRGANLPDRTHDHHYSEGEIRDLVATLDWSLYRPVLQRFRKTETLLELVIRLFNLKKKLAPQPRPTALTPEVARKAQAVVAEMARYGHAVRIVEGYRSFERQAALYAQGRTTAGNIVTNAKAGQSFHNYGVAVDFVFRKEGYNANEALWQLLGKVGKLQGFEWGGDKHWIAAGFQDRPHFQYKKGYTLRDFQKGKVDYKKFN